MNQLSPQGFKKVFSDADIEALKIMSRETIGWKISLEQKRVLNHFDSKGRVIETVRPIVVKS